MERAEAAFSSGDTITAGRLLAGVLNDPGATAAGWVQALSDLAVISWADGRADDAETYLLRALAIDPGYTPALENLSALCEARSDLVQATHWARRAAFADRHAPAGWRRLATLSMLQRRWSDARVALHRAGLLGVDVSHELEAIDGRDAPPVTAETAAPAPAIRRVLIVVDSFFPSLGGTERLAEGVGVTLEADGVAVDVATRPLAERTSRAHRGMAIHELHGDPLVALESLLRAGDYDASLVFSAPTCWPVIASLQVLAPRPRVVVVPCVNVENDAALRGDPRALEKYAGLLARADVVGYSSHSGPDLRLCEDLGVSGVYVPNATEVVAPASPSPTAALAAEAPLLLMVANMWPEKNHLGLLRTLALHRGDWRLAIIGGPSPLFPQIADEVRAVAAEDPRIHLLGPAGPAEVAAAMRDASLLLLPSLAEATPLVLLEAMSHCLPWIATPTCGAAHDHAGGLIVPLAQFGEAIDFLLANRRAARVLQAAGRAHWRRCYTWDVMGPRYRRLLNGEPVGELGAPSNTMANTAEIRREFYDGRPAANAGPSGG
jgi:glycosyltransferase involved in cell wall biosynthesis